MIELRAKRKRFMRGNSKGLVGLLIFISAISLTGVIDNFAWADLVQVTCGALEQRPCVSTDAGWWEGGLRLDGCDRGLKSVWDWDRWWWVCLDDTRLQNWADTVQTWWSYGALLEQRKLARNEPINWVMHLAGHNAFNNEADGYFIIPNQTYSITDQLKMGARVVMLDVHNLLTGLKLSHAGEGVFHWGATETDRHFVMALREIREWLVKNPNEVIIIEIEDYLGGLFEGDSHAQNIYIADLQEQLGQYILKTNQKPLDRWPTLEEMRTLKRQVIVLSQNFYDSELLFNGQWNSRYKFDYEGSKAKNFDCSHFLYPFERFSEIYEDRLVAVFGWIYNGPEEIGLICGSDITNCPGAYLEDLVSCNITIIGLDRLIDHNRSRDLIWSWEEEERGWTQENKAAVQRSATGRFHAVDPQEVHPFACGEKRDMNPSLWENWEPQPQWRITQRAGTWEEGASACCQEFGSEKLVFSVPVNGLQNKQLYDLTKSIGEDVWLAYRDVGGGNWEIDHGQIFNNLNISGSAYFYPLSPTYRASFSLGVTGPTSPSGWLRYYYTQTRMNFVSTGITSVSPSCNIATISGTGTVNGVGGYTFTATVTNGLPDSFGIVIKKSDGTTYYSAGPKNVTGGNLVIQ